MDWKYEFKEKKERCKISDCSRWAGSCVSSMEDSGYQMAVGFGLSWTGFTVLFPKCHNFFNMILRKHILCSYLKLWIKRLRYQLNDVKGNEYHFSKFFWDGLNKKLVKPVSELLGCYHSKGSPRCQPSRLQLKPLVSVLHFCLPLKTLFITITSLCSQKSY